MRYPEPHEILDDLGDKIVFGISDSIAYARREFAEYSQAFPRAVARAAGRTNTSWIHDATWEHLKLTFDDIAEVGFRDSDPTHDMYVRNRYRFRFKRHTPLGRISSYPTQSALDFITQDPDLLTELGMTQLNLTAGYEWDSVTQTMGDSVLSLRDGSFSEVVWITTLPSNPATASDGATPIAPRVDGPSAPIIEVTDREDDAETGSE